MIIWMARMDGALFDGCTRTMTQGHRFNVMEENGSG